jgi:hypothetical protein
MTMTRFAIAALVAFVPAYLPTLTSAAERDALPTDSGFRGIWYRVFDRPTQMIRYSGGLSTYPQQIRPFAVYSDAAGKNYFCYGGTDADNSTLLHMVSYDDHDTGMVSRPRILLDKQTTAAHDNPCIAMADSDASERSVSRLYFATRSGEVYQLPAEMEGDYAAPQRVVAQEP